MTPAEQAHLRILRIEIEDMRAELAEQERRGRSASRSPADDPCRATALT
ncbi:MAG: hypothetical protein IPJ27_01385 [Candidatus Accumulibacter sp.]|uniref:Uncharacterized protein n=1 Tax=Candidatus Accumulibacter proximus TaxID=2954385 RepID=A0A935PW34_9PROT|nr:hypothetical protein [Candidatus Accumulibacter proximus]